MILDGHRRWATERGVSTARAYRAGALRVRDLLAWCEDVRIPVVTVWALSQNNFRRGADAVGEIADAVVAGMREMAGTTGWHLRAIGSLDVLGEHRAARLREIAERTAGAGAGTLNVAVAYSGRAEIVAAVRALFDARASGAVDRIDEQTLGRYLFTAGQPDVDLVIRTCGEQRLSGFLPWQAAHAEYYFTQLAWPDFDRRAFDEALRAYRERARGFGS